MISITYNYTIIPVDITEIEHNAQSIITWMGYADFDLGILLTDNKTIQDYNKTFRHKDEPTDILSFPFHPGLQGGEMIMLKNEDDQNLGDLIISLEFIQDVCVEENKTTNEHIRTLLCHGICHLLGYDHYTEETDRVMKAKEEWLAAKFCEE
jgi:rRNA maturation RNase YbeY